MLVFRWRPPVEPLCTRWIVQATVVAITQAAELPQLAAVIGPPGERGPAGELAPAATLVTDVAVAAGTPLVVDRSTGRFSEADALVYSRSLVIGLAAADTASGHVVDAIGAGSMTLADWSAVTGTMTLLPGQLYYLAEGGGLTTTRPTTPGSSVAVVAEAASTATLNLRRLPPILL